MAKSYVIKSAQPFQGFEGAVVVFQERAFWEGDGARVGDEMFIWRTDGPSGFLHSVGVLEAAVDSDGKKLLLTVRLIKQASQPLTTSELRPYRDSIPDEPMAELASKLYRHAHDKCASIEAETADYLREFFQGYRGVDSRYVSIQPDLHRGEQVVSKMGDRETSRALTCPTCGSSDIVKSTVMVDQGTSYSKGVTVGAGMTRLGPTAGVAKSRSESLTAEARKNTAPLPAGGCMTAFAVWAVSELFLSFLMVFVTGGRFLLAMGLAFLISIGLGVLTFVLSDHKADALANEERKQAYDRQWYCRRCGSRFLR